MSDKYNNTYIHISNITKEMMKMKNGNKIKQMVLPMLNTKTHEGCLIGNCNTGKLHSPRCSAISMMREIIKSPQTEDISHLAAGAMRVMEQITQLIV